MKLSDKIEELTRSMADAGLDCMIIPPSGDMNYLIGFNPGGCERFQAVFATRKGDLFCVTNRLYQEDMGAALPENTPMYTWDDAGSFQQAVEKGFAAHGLTQAAVGINDAVRAVDLMALQTLFPDCRFVDGGPVLSACRIIKTPEQIRAMKAAGARADAVMDELKSFIRPGITELDIKNYILDAFAKQGLAPSFTPIVASGANNSRPHYNKDGRVITEKDVIILDFGCMVDGFCSDTSRTFFLGEPGERNREIYAIVKKAFEAAAAAVRQGVTAGEVDRAARDIIEGAGYGEYFLNRTGHGIGMDVHEEPFIRGNSPRVLAPGMAFSIEPGIYIPGEVGMRIEDIYIVNEKGEGETLNRSDRELTII
ncbi:MAG: aminopeptidase P family protein [Desulfobacter sp.]|nr:MAG: aminopeptidase P family protein [Desulfobacter sp.]